MALQSVVAVGRIVAGGVAAMLAAATAVAAGEACRPCAVEGGTYETLAPQGWDGKSSLGLLVVFHGYTGSGAQILANDALTALAAEHGYLLVAPNGRANARGRTSWSHQGSPAQNRNEFAFIDAVLADVRARYPLADAPPVLAGFSQGGSMVWDLACRRGGDFARYVAVAGAFWEPMPARCAMPAGELVHVHGLSDRVVPLEGRPIGDRWRQGDVLVGLERFKRAGGCPAVPDRREALGALDCRSWTSCATGALTLCLHDGGHEFRLGPLDALLGAG